MDGAAAPGAVDVELRRGDDVVVDGTVDGTSSLLTPFPVASPASAAAFPSPAPAASPAEVPSDVPSSSPTELIFVAGLTPSFVSGAGPGGGRLGASGMTLGAIGLTLAGGAFVSVITVVVFGIFVVRRDARIAPRCTSRHPNAIWRSRKDLYGTRSRNRKGGEKRSGGRERKESEERRWAGRNEEEDDDDEGNIGSGGRARESRRDDVAERTIEPASHASVRLRALSPSVSLGLRKRGASRTASGELDPDGSGTLSPGNLDEYGDDDDDGNDNDNDYGNGHGGGNDNDAYGLNGAMQSPATASTVAHHGSARRVDGGAHRRVDHDRYRSDDAFRNEDSEIAPRSAAPSSAYYAPRPPRPGVRPPPPHRHPQDRGDPFLGWIPWTLRLSYGRMMTGIPGTGTREGGMGGRTLAVNLDAIVLFRFHALCLQVTAVACFICIGIILPLNLTACDDGLPRCRLLNLTDYGETTIENIPYGVQSSGPELSASSLNMFTSIFWAGEKNLPSLLRFYAIAFCTWYLAWFTLKSVERDWTENLALRRVYYLEADHYGNRRSELAKIGARRSGRSGQRGGDVGGGEGEEGGGAPRGADDDDEDPGVASTGKREHRDPWIPDPEHRDTVPAVELYSVLVGGLPSLPEEVLKARDMRLALECSDRASIDWQLAVTSTFFDHCVPNQPGFSSSVVAVTILPGAKELAKAWRKWYAAAAALRRLRFVRKVIEEKMYYAIDDGDEESGYKSSSSKRPEDREAVESDYFQESANDATTSPSKQVTFVDQGPAHQPHDDIGPRSSLHLNADDASEIPSDADHHIFRALNYGPEQRAVYVREMAQGAAACCPNGCAEGRVRAAPIDRLREMEDATIVRVQNAVRELQCAQMQAAVSMVDGTERGAADKATAEGGDEAAAQCPPVTDGGSGGPSADALCMSANGRASRADGRSRSRTVDVPPRTRVLFPDEGSVERSLTPASEINAEMAPVPRTDWNEVGGAGQALTPSGRNWRGSSLAGLKSSPGPGPSRSSGNSLRMTSEGRFLFERSDMASEEAEASEAGWTPSAESSLRHRRANASQHSQSATSLSEREGGASRSSDQWDQVNSILRRNESGDYEGGRDSKIETGVWKRPSLKSFLTSLRADFMSGLKAAGKWTKGAADPLTSKLARDSTYAVVTFSSRQAAVAARHCLADGRGVERWISAETVPVAPLADAAPCDIITCRGCCRPVTLNLNQNQLMIRRYLCLASLAFIYVFYTIPITAAQSLVSPQKLEETLPGLFKWMNQTPYISADVLSGLVAALLYTSFFALCPVLFKAIANSGSRATSVQEAEKHALKYYWYFMLVTAFVFTGLAETAFNIWNHSNVEQSVEMLLRTIAAQTPLTTAATWLNWIIVRTTMTLPLQYLLGMNTFLFAALGWKCCARCVIGGGPGGPIPYRIYIDGGTVFLCVVALAPQSPLVAPVSLLYYLVCVPLWRRNCIFMYRPKFDTGGERWPFLSDMLITSLFMSQFLLCLQMALKDAFGPAFIAACPALPTYLFRNYLIKRFRKAYKDAGLLQTSLLDGWDNTVPTSLESREEFRKFLVDAHKAAYIPVCIAGGATNILTAEPAVVMPSDNDDMLGYADVATSADDVSSPPFFEDGSRASSSPSPNGTADVVADASPAAVPSHRPGACARRALSSSSSPKSPMHMWQKVQDQASASTADPADPGCAQQ